MEHFPKAQTLNDYRIKMKGYFFLLLCTNKRENKIRTQCMPDSNPRLPNERHSSTYLEHVR